MRCLRVLVVICGGLVGGVLSADESLKPEPLGQDVEVQAVEIPTTDAAVRQAVSRSLPFLEKEGVAWMHDRGCLSCHHVPFLLWSHRAAHAQGVAVDLQKLTEWDQWAIKDSLAHRNSFRLPKADLEKIDATTLPAAVKDKVKPIVDQAFANEAEFLQKLTPLLTDEELKTHQAVLVNAARLPLYAVDRTGGGLDVLGQLLLGSDQTAQDSTAEPGRNIDGSDHHEFHRGVIELMNRLQLADGSWTPGNQLATMRKWSLPAANQATTMWATLALEAYHARDQRSPKQSEQIERAVAYQRQQPPQAGNREWLATRLLFERQFGTPDEVSKFR